MKKKAIALAVGAMCVAPAAQSQIMFGNDTIGTVQIYGKLYPQVIWANSHGATQPGATVSTLAAPGGTLTGGSVANPGSRFAVDSQNSYLGFRGERNLGSSGLKGLWQLEQSIEIDTGTGTFSNRNSFVGLAGGFGTVKLGNMDTIYKEYGQVESMLGLTSGNFVSPSNVLSHIGVGNNNAARFHERAPNSVQYQTPIIAGFQAGIQYSPDEQKNDAAQPLDRSLLSMGIKWENGPAYLALGYEVHKDRFGGSSNVAAALSNIGTADARSRDKAFRFSAAYDIGNHRIGGDISKLKYDESGQTPGVTRFQNYEHVTWAISLESKWGGPFRTAIEYVGAADGSCKLTIGDCSTTGLKGSLFAGALAYDLDKQTFIYLLAARLTNGESARYDNWAASSPARGGDVDQIALGIQYRF